MSRKHVFWLLLGSLLCCGVTTLLAATSRLTFKHPRSRGANVRFTVTAEGRIIRQDSAHRPASADAAPKVQVPESEYDFGIMDRLTTGTHQFVVHNVGSAPLQLQQGPTSCKCTFASFATEKIPPGGQGTVTVQWNTGRSQRVYAHEANVFTNDPDHKMVTLRIRGLVRMRLGIDPPEVVFPRVTPDAAATQQVVLYSQVWDSFDVVGGTSSRDGITWSVTLLDEETRQQFEARSGCRLSVTVPGDMPCGFFQESLQLQIQPADSSAAEVCDLAVTGKVLRRLAVYGPQINSGGVIRLGHVGRGEGLKKRFVLKVRDPDPELRVQRIRTTPDFLQVRIQPYEAEAPVAGLYHLDIEVPSSAPACAYLGDQAGTIEAEFEHPRIPKLQLQLQLAVVEG